MKKVLILIALGAFAIACGSETSNDGATTSSTTATATPVKKVDGEKIYKNYCVTCHGLYGDMGASGAHDLTQSVLSLEERIKVITDGRNTMTPMKGLLSEEKIKAVAEYTITLKKDK